MSGAWLYRYTERPSGFCNVGTIESLSVIGPSEPQPCTGSKSISADRCEITFRKLRCLINETGNYLTTDGTLRIVADDRLEGIVQLYLESPTEPSLNCSSVFDVIATQQ